MLTGMKVEPSAFLYLSGSAPMPLNPLLSFMCPKHILSSHFIPSLHPSHVLKFISLSLPWSAHLPPSISPISPLLSLLSDSLITLYQSGLWRAGAVQHSIAQS